jgi:hypothetical protein
MRHTLVNCSNCKAGPEFIKITSEPGTGVQITFCGRCHHIVSSHNEQNKTEPVQHMKEFAKSMSRLLMSLSGSEVMANVFIEGVKSGVDMALSVPWSQKENFWMEKYGVVKADLIKELEAKLAAIREKMTKLAGNESGLYGDAEEAVIIEKINQLKSEQ